MSSRQHNFGSSVPARSAKAQRTCCSATNLVRWATLTVSLPHALGFSLPILPSRSTTSLVVSTARHDIFSKDSRSPRGYMALWAGNDEAAAEDLELTRQVLRNAASALENGKEYKEEAKEEEYEYIEDDGAYAASGQYDEDDGDNSYLEYQERVGDGRAFKPKPPPIPPMINEVLENDLMEAERRIQLYEMEIEMMRDQLILKSTELQDEQNAFRDEKSGLLNKIAEFANILAQRDEELTAQAEADAEFKAREDALKKEVVELVGQLKEKTADYEKELATTKELKRQYEEANDALEFEQMAFQKEKENLQNALDGEKKNIKSLENKLKEAQATSERIRDELTEKLKGEQEKLVNTEGALQNTKDNLQRAQQDIQDILKEKELSLAESKRELNSQRELSGVEREELKRKIQAEQFVVKNVRQELKAEKEQFEKSRKELEAQVANEQTIVMELQEEMVREMTKFQAEQTKLKNRIAEESARLAVVETELAAERDKYSKMKEQLEFKLAEEIRVRQLKKRQMNERYTEIRKEMTELWENSKRDARKEQARLTKKYERKLDDVKKQVARLAGDIDESEASSSDMSYLLAKAEENQSRLVAESQAMQEKYIESLKQRDIVIGDLQDNVTNLRTVIREKENIIEEQRRQLGRYETSFRAVARLSLAVTGNKIKKASGWFKRPGQKNEENSD